MANLERLQPQKIPHTASHQLSVPKMRLKPSSTKLRPNEHSNSSPPRQPVSSTSRKDSTLLQPRKSSLPKPMAVINSPTMTPVTTLKPRTSPPTRTHPVFGGSLSPEKRPRNVIRRKQSSTSSSFSLGTFRTGSASSFNASTASLATSQSSVASNSRNVSQSSILGITMPPTTSSSSRPSTNSKKAASLSPNEIKSNQIPRIQTRDLPLEPPPSVGESAPDSSPSTRYTDSPGPFNYSPASSSASSYSPGFGPVAYRMRQTPTPGPTRNNLDSVRESTTSTSSGSTIRAAKDTEGEDQDVEAIGPWTDSPIPMSPPLLHGEPNYFGYQNPSAIASIPTTPFYSYNQSPRLEPISSPSPLLLSAPSPALGASSRRKVSISSAASFSRLGNHTPGLSTSSAPRGLGVSMPTAASLAKGRSKSLSGSAAFSLPQRGTRKDVVTPPIPSPGLPPRKNSAPAIRGATPAPRDLMAIQAGLASRVMTSRGDSKERVIPISRERSPTRTSPGKPKTSFFGMRVRTKTNESLEEKDRDERRKGPAAGTGHEGYATFTKRSTSRGRSGSTTSESADRSGSANSTATGSWGRAAGAGSRRGSESKEPADEYLRGRLKPVVIAGGGEVVENYNLAGAGELMMRSGSEESSKEKKSFEFGKRAHTPVMMSREGSAESRLAKRTAVTPNPPPPPSPAPSDAPPKKKGWNFLKRTETSLQRQATPAPPATPVPISASAAAVPGGKLKVQTVRRPAHYLVALGPDEQREAAHLAEQMQRQRWANNNYASTLRQQHHVHSSKPSNASSILLPASPLPPPTPVKATAPVPITSAPAPLAASPAPPAAPEPPAAPAPVSGPVPTSTEEQAKKEIRQAKANERKRLQTVGRIPAPGYKRNLSQGKIEVPSAQIPTPVPANPARIRMQMLAPINTQVIRGDINSTDMLTAPPRIGQPFEESFRRANQEFQVNWDGYGLVPTPTTARPILGDKRIFNFDPLEVSAAQCPENQILPPIDTPVTSTTIKAWPIQNGPAPTLAPDVVLEEDDIWNEYDDLLYNDDMFGDSESQAFGIQGRTRSTTSSLGSPFQYADLCSAFPELLKHKRAEETLPTPNLEETSLYPDDSPTISPTLPNVITATSSPSMSIGETFALDYPLFSPSTPFSVSSFIGSYGDRDSVTSQASLPSLGLPPVSSPPAVPGPLVTLGIQPKHKDKAKTHKPKGSNGSSGSNLSSSSYGSEIDASDDEMKIRLWALMTSKWLSFNKVLVSPAHELMESINANVGPRASGGGRVLVVDGLGTGTLHITNLGDILLGVN